MGRYYALFPSIGAQLVIRSKWPDSWAQVTIALCLYAASDLGATRVFQLLAKAVVKTSVFCRTLVPSCWILS